MSGTTDHTSKNFDIELESLRTRVLQMGGLAEQQVRKAIDAMYSGNIAELEAVVRDDQRINELEVDIDALCNQIIAKRQPTAIDLRMIVSVLKTISDVERVGDKAQKIARLAIGLHQENGSKIIPQIDLRGMAEKALTMLRLALDGFARLDVNQAAEAMRLDDQVNAEYKAMNRQLITYMMEDPRTISRSLDIISIAKAVERIGDHACNIADYVIYMVKGINVRHESTEEILAKLGQDA
ncbi:phosphate signaling complex protein PhoU [Propionivibrio limicola]|uniref:phosphate signaling complex protein PhoU n=1 Tax=Propionivibrio limicola TaxID=167645 RepID=UPI0012924220|nr:phosphate signaling complex protein PhoU [Propionivibrio limicola]